MLKEGEDEELETTFKRMENGRRLLRVLRLRMLIRVGSRKCKRMPEPRDAGAGTSQ